VFIVVSQELEPTRAIIERLHNRDHYQVVDFKVFSFNDKDKQNVTPARIVEVAKSGCLKGVDEELVAQLTVDHVAVGLSILHYGRGPNNPLDEVTFYSKQQPDGKLFQMGVSYPCIQVTHSG